MPSNNPIKAACHVWFISSAEQTADCTAQIFVAPFEFKRLFG